MKGKTIKVLRGHIVISYMSTEKQGWIGGLDRVIGGLLTLGIGEFSNSDNNEADCLGRCGASILGGLEKQTRPVLIRELFKLIGYCSRAERWIRCSLSRFLLNWFLYFNFMVCMKRLSSAACPCFQNERRMITQQSLFREVRQRLRGSEKSVPWEKLKIQPWK